MILAIVVGVLVLCIIGVFLSLLNEKADVVEKKASLVAVFILCPSCGSRFSASDGYVSSRRDNDLFQCCRCNKRNFWKMTVPPRIIGRKR